VLVWILRTFFKAIEAKWRRALEFSPVWVAPLRKRSLLRKVFPCKTVSGVCRNQSSAPERYSTESPRWWADITAKADRPFGCCHKGRGWVIWSPRYSLAILMPKDTIELVYAGERSCVASWGRQTLVQRTVWSRSHTESDFRNTGACPLNVGGGCGGLVLGIFLTAPAWSSGRICPVLLNYSEVSQLGKVLSFAILEAVVFQ